MIYVYNEIACRQTHLKIDSNLFKKGTYKIVNLSNDKFYIGSTMDSFLSRFRSHIERLIKNKHQNPHLQASFNKYGKDNFSFNIIEIIEQDDLVLKKEQYLLDTLKGLTNHYNISMDATAPMKGRKHTKETIEKISAFSKSRAKEIGENTRKCRTGTKHTKETIERFKIAAKNRDDSKRITALKTKEFREKQSLLHKGVKRNEKWQNKMLAIVKSPDYRQKMSEVKKGVKPSEATKIKMALAAGSKKYIFIKDGIEHEIINLRKFYRDYKLDRHTIRDIIKTQSSKEYKGWKLKLVTETLPSIQS